jgi:hypothetical protein
MNETTTKNETEKTKPAHKIRLGNLSAFIWENVDDDGKTNYRATVSKSYRDYRGEWQQTGSFRSDDLVLLSKLANLAAEWMLAHQNE